MHLLWATSMTTINVHKGAVLPAARVVVIMVPVLAMCFYVFVVRRRSK